MKVFIIHNCSLEFTYLMTSFQNGRKSIQLHISGISIPPEKKPWKTNLWSKNYKKCYSEWNAYCYNCSSYYEQLKKISVKLIFIL
jgi:hypothetical protein